MQTQHSASKVTKAQEVQRDGPGKDRVSGSSEDAQVRWLRSHECGKAPEAGKANGSREEAPGSTLGKRLQARLSSAAGLHVFLLGGSQ